MVWEDCNYKQEKDEGDGRQNPLVVLLAGIPDLELEALLDYLPIKDEVDQAPGVTMEEAVEVSYIGVHLI